MFGQKSDTALRICLIACASCATLAVSRTAWAQATRPRVVLSRAQIDATTSQLQSPDPAEVTAAITQIRSWIESGSAPSTDMAKVWVPALVKVQRNEEVADLCLQMVLVSPSPSNVRDFLIPRVEALVRLNRSEEALQAAKSVYNACDIKNMDRVNMVVRLALTNRFPEDRGIGARFAMEQAQSSSTAPATQPNSGILKSIKIDPAIYAEALAKWEAKSKTSRTDAEKYATMLLLAGQPDKAEEVLRDLVAQNPDFQAQQRYADGLARVAKAQDGNLTRAYSMTRARAAAATRTADLP
jgi:hypothetical protein